VTVQRKSLGLRCGQWAPQGRDVRTSASSGFSFVGYFGPSLLLFNGQSLMRGGVEEPGKPFDETGVSVGARIGGGRDRTRSHAREDGVGDVAVRCVQAASPEMCSRLCVRALLPSR
jgi:hypothetical protein